LREAGFKSVSQYPYQPPSPTPYGYGYYGQDPLGALLAPARRASLIMFIVGGLMLPCGVLMPYAAKHAPDPSQMTPQQAAQVQQAEQQLSAMGWSMSKAYAVMGTACVSVPGLILVVLGVVVRRGGIGGVVTSIIFCGLLTLFFGLMTLTALAQGGVVAGVPLLLISAALIGAEVFLFQAAGRAGQVAAYQGMASAAGYAAGYSGGYGQPGYPSQQPQNWQQPGVGPWGQQQAGQWGQPQQSQGGWGPPPPPGDREG
jgi:hypothetical protein